MNKKLTFITIIATFLFFPHTILAQGGVWTWVSGDTTVNGSLGSYGTLGVSAPTNAPGRRYQAATWTDKDGNFWMFGGSNLYLNNIQYNDLWKLNPSTEEWTWVHGPQYGANVLGNYGAQGVSSPLNIPPARSLGILAWTGDDGHLYMYSGMSGRLFSDLWKYDISLNEWTWLSGSNSQMSPQPNYGVLGVPAATNNPSFLAETESAWFFDDKLWLFGGDNVNFDEVNAVWTFDLNTFLWTWVAGSNTPPYTSINSPSPRYCYSNWKNKDDKFYVFGGGVPSPAPGQLFNDLWRFDPITLSWTFLGGGNGFSNGTLCVPDSTNWPKERFEYQRGYYPNSKCISSFWLYSGSMRTIERQDLWHYNVFKNVWTLVWKGNQISYGTKGVADPNNSPSPNTGCAMWVDKNQQIWLFDANGRKNVLWKFTPDLTCVNTSIDFDFTLPKDTTICKGELITIPFSADVNVEILPKSNSSYDTLNHIATFYPNSKQTFSIRLTNKPSNPCPFDTTISFTVDMISPNINGITDTFICLGSQYEIKFIPEANIQIDPAGTFTYDQNNHSAIFRPNRDQTYSINLKSNALAQCPFDTTLFFTLKVLQQPLSDFAATLNCDGVAQIIVKNNSSEANSYQWYINGIQYSVDPQPYPKNIEEFDNQEICVSLKASNSCFSDSATFCIPSESQFKIPNAFSPNGDGHNDVFKIIRIGNGELDIQYLSVYNRWGQRVFHTTHWQEGWDGSYKGDYAELGTYVFIIKVKEGSCTKEVKGDVTLLR